MRKKEIKMRKKQLKKKSIEQIRENKRGKANENEEWHKWLNMERGNEMRNKKKERSGKGSQWM